MRIFGGRACESDELDDAGEHVGDRGDLLNQARRALQNVRSARDALLGLFQSDVGQQSATRIGGDFGNHVVDQIFAGVDDVLSAANQTNGAFHGVGDVGLNLLEFADLRNLIDVALLDGADDFVESFVVERDVENARNAGQCFFQKLISEHVLRVKHRRGGVEVVDALHAHCLILNCDAFFAGLRREEVPFGVDEAAVGGTQVFGLE